MKTTEQAQALRSAASALEHGRYSTAIKKVNMVAGILGGQRTEAETQKDDAYDRRNNEMDTKQVPLTTEEVGILRNALNLAAEYSADIDDPQHYDDDDMQRVSAKIDRFRKLDDYLQQFDQDEHRPVTHKCHGGQTLYGTREDCLFCKDK